jgi:glycosyltransferase involved in cell wall biosynthesis
VGKADVRYLAPGEGRVATLTQLVGDTEHDILYLNSAFSPHMTILPLILGKTGRIPRRPVVLAPRGEFSPDALRLKSSKKHAFLRFARTTGLYDEVTWQASSPTEEEDIRRWFGWRAKVLVAPDLLSRRPGQFGSRRVKRPGALRIVFLSRISPMKNLDEAIRLLAGVKGRVEFHIYGPCEDQDYWTKCQEAIRTLPDNIHVEYRGAIANEKVARVLRQYDLFFLPTRGENYGHVVLEALMAGCPVLISDRTPWSRVQERGAGWSVPLDRPDQFHAVLQQCMDMEHGPMSRVAERAMEFSKSVLADDQVLSANYALFQAASELQRLAA